MLVFCIICLFIELGWTFIFSIITMWICYVWNSRQSYRRGQLQKLYMKKQDQRINLTTECLQNIMIVKLYSWTQPFLKMI